jgi:hypothetical protein
MTMCSTPAETKLARKGVNHPWIPASFGKRQATSQGLSEYERPVRTIAMLLASESERGVDTYRASYGRVAGKN